MLVGANLVFALSFLCRYIFVPRFRRCYGPSGRYCVQHREAQLALVGPFP